MVNKIVIRAKTEKFGELLNRLNTDDPSPKDVSEFQEYLVENPDVWQAAGDLSNTVRNNLISKTTSNSIVEESVKFGIGRMQEEMGYQNTTMLEKMLIDNIINCWMRLQYIEMLINSMTGKYSFREGEHWEKRLSASQRRYLRAVETFARVRKLLSKTPALQVNIATQGGQQVNVAGDVGTGKK